MGIKCKYTEKHAYEEQNEKQTIPKKKEVWLSDKEELQSAYFLFVHF